MVFVKRTIQNSLILAAAALASCNQEQQEMFGKKDEDTKKSQEANEVDTSTFIGSLRNAVQSELITAGYSTSSAKAVANAGMSASLALVETSASIQANVETFGGAAATAVLAEQKAGRIDDVAAKVGMTVIGEQSVEVAGDFAAADAKQDVNKLVVFAVFSQMTKAVLEEDASGKTVGQVLAGAIQFAFESTDATTAGFAANAILQRAGGAADVANELVKAVVTVAITQPSMEPGKAVEAVMDGFTAAGKKDKQLNAIAVAQSAIDSIGETDHRGDTGDLATAVFQKVSASLVTGDVVKLLGAVVAGVAAKHGDEVQEVFEQGIGFLVADRKTAGATEIKNAIAAAVDAVPATAREEVFKAGYAAAGVASKVDGVKAAIGGLVAQYVPAERQANFVADANQKFETASKAEFVPRTVAPALETDLPDLDDGDADDDDDDDSVASTTATTPGSTSTGGGTGTTSGTGVGQNTSTSGGGTTSSSGSTVGAP